MKVIFDNDTRHTGMHSVKMGTKVFTVSCKDAITVDVDGVKVLIDGKIYYARDGSSTTLVSGDTVGDIISSIVRQYGVARLPQYLEGSYVGCWFNDKEKTAGTFTDSLNRVPFYIIEHGENITLSTVLKDVVAKNAALDQLSLYSYLLLGYPAGQDTFYQDVKKVGNDESFYFNVNGVDRHHTPSVQKIKNFEEHDLTRYDELVSNAVSSRTETSNVVMNSGGWDSTSILYQLVQCRSKDSVTAAVFDVVLPDGQSFNSYEVDKAKRIGKFFGVNTERAEIDYRDESLIEYWESHRENFRNNHSYFWLHHLKIADMIGSNAHANTRVFNGEAADSIHNFGFSQFVSVNYDNMQLREMADKAKSYLYGPSFFQSVLNEKHREDKVLNFFQSYYGKEKFENTEKLSELDRRKSYFQAFMLSYPRVPFAKWQMNSVASELLQSNYADHVDKAYFHDVVGQSQPDSLYYWLLQLYRRFHFNSYQIGVTQVALQPYGLHCAMPFLDSQLVEYMYQMPEDWGRGLELRTTKYPLRHLAEHKWRMPLDILMEKGPHSYIAEGDPRWSYAGGTWNIYCEIMFKSVFNRYFKSLLSAAKLDQVFDPKYFDISQMQEAVDHYVAGEERTKDVTLLFRLGVLLSIGFVNQ
ncbi:MAG: asparagine synthase-related protein [Gallionellaceae bacterium]